MHTPAAAPESPVLVAEICDLVDLKTACRVIGGQNSPIDKATFYRGIARGDFPRPIKITKQKSRWRRSELLAVLERAAAQRKVQAA